MMLTHYLGEHDANIYLESLSNSKTSNGVPDYNKAQQVVNDSIQKRTGSVPANTPIKDYLIKFNNKLKEIK
jgi:hypothetical protein